MRWVGKISGSGEVGGGGGVNVRGGKCPGVTTQEVNMAVANWPGVSVCVRTYPKLKLGASVEGVTVL